MSTLSRVATVFKTQTILQPLLSEKHFAAVNIKVETCISRCNQKTTTLDDSKFLINLAQTY